MPPTPRPALPRSLLVGVLGVTACGPPPDEVSSLPDHPSSLARLTSLPGDETQPVFSPDGDRVAFTSDERGNRDIRVVEVATGELTAVAVSDADEGEPAWSPDGSRIAFVSIAGGASAVWLTPAGGGPPSRVTDPADRAGRPRWSPDGEWIAFAGRAEHGNQTWIARPDGADRRRLTGPGADHVPYGWSPDGRHVLVIRYGEEQDVFGVPVDGGDWVRITTHAGEEWWPQWSPVGDRVVFYTTWDDEMTEVWSADVATGELTRVTDLPVEDFRPTWSPDGAWIAYSSDRVSKSGVWVSSADGTVAVPIATDGRAGGLHSWSPDGRRLAFSYLRSKEQIFVVSTDGGDPEPLTDGGRDAVEAVASPDGSRIAFESTDVGTEADLFVLDVGSGAVTRLTEEITYNARPAWSPDGAMIAFERSPGGGPRTTQVGLLELATGEIRTVTEHGYVRQPVWCGGTVVYTREHSRAAEGPDQLWAIDPAGGSPTRLTDGPGDKRTSDCAADGALLYAVEGVIRRALVVAGRLESETRVGAGEGARWSPDGARIAFLSTRDGAPDLYVAMLGGEVRRVTDTPGSESWPDWLGDRLIYGANPGGRDIWIADTESMLGAVRP
ncbi:MAG: hypothetical protein ABFS34_02490 [Gemmatimonadota bacterium]